MDKSPSLFWFKRRERRKFCCYNWANTIFQVVIQHLALQQISKSKPKDFPLCPNTQPVPSHTPLQRPAYQGIPLL